MDKVRSTMRIDASLEPYAMAEQRELQEVWLSEKVISIGRHAFYNCRNLRRLYFWDTLKDIGDGAFKNCEQLRELVIYLSGRGDQAGLKSILSELTGEFTVFLQEEGKLCGSLSFPAYLYDYEENNEARIINQITYGAGVHYRECVREAGIDLTGYDRIFRQCVNLDREAAWKVAFYRCLCPVQLREEDRLRYEDWLHENRKEVLKALSGSEEMAVPVVQGECSTRIERGGLAVLRSWLSLDPYRSEEEWMQSIDWLQSEGKWEAVGLLMQERQKRYGEKKRKFEF